MQVMSPSSWTYEDLERFLDVLSEPSDLDPRRAKKRARILDAARRLFIHHGYRKASLDEVAADAGVAKGTVYLYFPSKADLLSAALIEERRQILENFRPAFAEGVAGKERLRIWLRTVLDSLEAMPLSRRLLTGDREILAVLDDLDEDYVRQMADMKVSFLAPFIAEARGRDEATDDDRLSAEVLLRTFQSSGMFQNDGPNLGLDRRAFHHRLVDLLVEGIAHTPAYEEIR